MESEQIKQMTPLMAAKVFGKFYRSISQASNLYIIVGAKGSGKSTIIDLLTCKNIIQVKDQELQIFKLQVQGGQDSQYPSIYIANTQVNQIKNIFVELFTLTDNHQSQPLNLIKSIFLKGTADRLKNISIIMVIDQSFKQNITQNVEHLLHYFGITGSQLNENSEQLKQYCYLLLTKTEEDSSLDQMKQLITDLLDEDSGNTNVHQLLNTFNNDDRIMIFKNQTPSSQLASEIRTKFLPVQINEHFRKCIAQPISFDDVVLDIFDQKQICLFAIKLMKIISTLVSYALKTQRQKDKQKSNYQKCIKSAYDLTEANNKLDIKKMLGKWDHSILKDINIEQTNSQENIDIFKHLISLGIQLAQSFKAGAQNSEEYLDIIGSMIFCQEMVQWIDNSILQKAIQQMKRQLVNCSKFISSSGDKQSPAEKLPEPIVKSKQNQELRNFKKEILKKCKNNQQAMTYCLKVIKQKQQQPKYQWSDVRCYLKLLRQIIIQSSKYEGTFALQLLELYRYNDNFYDFDKLLDKYLLADNISIKILMNLFRQCQALKWYQCCIKCLNYGITNSVDDQIYNIFLKTKGKILHLYHQQYKNRSQSVQQEDSHEDKKYDLQITIESIKQKGSKIKDFKTYLQADNFRKIISQNSQ